MTNKTEQILKKRNASLSKELAAKNRELEIETALEKVRARTMAMQHSDELAETSLVLFQQFKELGKTSDQISIGIFKEDENVMELYSTLHGSQWKEAAKVDLSEPVVMKKIHAAWKKKKHSLVIDLEGDQLKKYNTYRKKVSNLTYKEKRWVIQVAFFSKGVLTFSTTEPHPKETIQLLERFAVVFDGTYTRFLDLQKAEAQTKESQIELALERVRARTMAMQKSEELKEVIQVVYDQFVHLNIKVEHTGFILDYKERDDMFIWLADKHEVPSQVTIPYFDSSHWNSFIDAKATGKNFFPTLLSFEEKNKFYKDLFKLFPVPDEAKEYYFSCPGLAGSTVLLDNISLYIENFEGIPFTNEENDTLMRLGKVFQQTYTRFLDLEKAEAQAREAQIEVSLERVRSRSLAMHKSEELRDVINMLYGEFQNLNVTFNVIAIQLRMDKSEDLYLWLSTADGMYDDIIHWPFVDLRIFHEIHNAWSSGKLETTHLKPEAKQFFEEYFKLEKVPKERKVATQSVELIDFFGSYQKLTALFLMRYTEGTYSQDEKDITQRFAKVFEQTYTRFLDLQKAEAQAKEAQIEASLERVRSKTMAMHSSNDVGDTVATMFNEFVKLGIQTNRCGILIFSDDPAAEVWTAKSNPDGKANLIIGKLDMTAHGLLYGILKSWKNKEAIYTYTMEGNDLINYYQALNDLEYYPTKFDMGTLPLKEFHSDFYFSDGSVFAFTAEAIPDEASRVIKRFAAVFGQTYRRYLDLQKAEAQARESKIEAALERVRSRTMAMQSSDELAETSAILFKQLIHLGIAPNRLYIGITNDNNTDIEFWITDEDGSKVSTMFYGDANKNSSIRKMYDGWKQKKTSIVIDMHGNELDEYFHYLGEELRVPFQGGLAQKRRIQYLSYFAKGFIGMASPDEQPEETLRLLERFAAVFNLTFTRFNDLKVAEAHAIQAEKDLIEIKEARKKAEDAFSELQAAQKQLIQSEKMASLGELTAGIAHEIQNPLNFVNNFSDVNKEMLEELKAERLKPNAERDNILEDELINDVIDNSEKINHHGKRAGDIVKGMLQHSQKSTGQKEPTNINALADEYLRLSYHGLRAKDKSFNAEMITDLDATIGNINIIPQDIGRVLLNLYNNAFYACTERSRSTVNGQISGNSISYNPTVSVTTKKSENSVLITVSDNGNGIPQNIVDKIFQPFFTTKPTGSGTGLGLSLSYDIVKAHGGEIRVESKEGNGSEFIIQLTVS